MGMLFGTAVLALAAQATGSGLTGYWPLDELTGTASADRSGNNRNGAHAGGPTIIQPSGRALNVPNPACLAFDGTDSVVSVPDDAGLRFTAAESFTLSAWVNVTALPGAWKGVVTKSREATPWYGIWISSGNQWVFGGPANITGPVATTGWHHVAVVQDGPGNTRALYLNGASVATGAAQAANGAGTFLIGGAGGVNEFFNGQVDEVRLHPRVLTLAEIQYLAAANGPPAAPGGVLATGLVGGVDVDWNATATTSPSAVTYNVKRSPTLGGTYATLSNTAGLTHLDATAPMGVQVFYAVSAVNFAGEGPLSSPGVPATALVPPPRTNNHEEGLLGDKCSCGSTIPASLPAWAALLAAALLAVSRRGR